MSTIISAAKHSFKKSTLLSFTWLGDRYTNTTKLNSINRFEGTLRGQYYLTDIFMVQMQVDGIFEKEKYGKTNSSFYFNKGKEFTACPGFEFILFDNRFHAGSELIWEQRSGATDVNHSTWAGATSL